MLCRVKCPEAPEVGGSCRTDQGRIYRYQPAHRITVQRSDSRHGATAGSVDTGEVITAGAVLRYRTRGQPRRDPGGRLSRILKTILAAMTDDLSVHALAHDDSVHPHTPRLQ